MNRPTKRAKARHQLFLDADLSEKLEALAAKPGASKSAILADAVAAWLNRRGSHELDDRFGLRLNRISAQLNRIERDQQVVLESLGLFVRYQLTVTAPLPEADQAARAVGRPLPGLRRSGRPPACGRRPDAEPEWSR